MINGLIVSALASSTQTIQSVCVCVYILFLHVLLYYFCVKKSL